jgi:hypothetical protein
MSSHVAADVVSRPAVAYFARNDAVYGGLLSGHTSLRSLPSELRGVMNALAHEDLLRVETVGNTEDRMLAKGLRLFDFATTAMPADRTKTLQDADAALRRAERMWTDNSVVHEALLHSASALKLEIDVVQQRLFNAAKVTPTIGTAIAAVTAFGPTQGGDTKTALNALRLLCGNESPDHLSRGAVLALAADAQAAKHDVSPLLRSIEEQFEQALATEVTSPDQLVRLADAAFVAQLIRNGLTDRYRHELAIHLEYRYTGLWSRTLAYEAWKPVGVDVDALTAIAKKGSFSSFFRR